MNKKISVLLACLFINTTLVFASSPTHSPQIPTEKQRPRFNFSGLKRALSQPVASLADSVQMPAHTSNNTSIDNELAEISRYSSTPSCSQSRISSAASSAAPSRMTSPISGSQSDSRNLTPLDPTLETPTAVAPTPRQRPRFNFSGLQKCLSQSTQPAASIVEKIETTPQEVHKPPLSRAATAPTTSTHTLCKPYVECIIRVQPKSESLHRWEIESQHIVSTFKKIEQAFVAKKATEVIDTLLQKKSCDTSDVVTQSLEDIEKSNQLDYMQAVHVFRSPNSKPIQSEYAGNVHAFKKDGDAVTLKLNVDAAYYVSLLPKISVKPDASPTAKQLICQAYKSDSLFHECNATITQHDEVGQDD